MALLIFSLMGLLMWHNIFLAICLAKIGPRSSCSSSSRGTSIGDLGGDQHQRQRARQRSSSSSSCRGSDSGRRDGNNNSSGGDGAERVEPELTERAACTVRKWGSSSTGTLLGNTGAGTCARAGFRRMYIRRCLYHCAVGVGRYTYIYLTASRVVQQVGVKDVPHRGNGNPIAPSLRSVYVRVGGNYLKRRGGGQSGCGQLSLRAVEAVPAILVVVVLMVSRYTSVVGLFPPDATALSKRT